MVEQVEVLGSKLQIRLALDGEGAKDSAIPVGVPGTAKRTLHDVAKSGARTVLDGNRVGGIV